MGIGESIKKRDPEYIRFLRYQAAHCMCCDYSSHSFASSHFSWSCDGLNNNNIVTNKRSTFNNSTATIEHLDCCICSAEFTQLHNIATKLYPDKMCVKFSILATRFAHNTVLHSYGIISLIFHPAPFAFIFVQ